jgi:selenocysteine lyase/cysteine desulfurase
MMQAAYRDLFDMPRDVAYLNAAGYSPLPKATAVAGRAAVGNKVQPWRLGPNFSRDQIERARAAAAKVINASVDDVALIPSVGYGVVAVAKNLNVPRGGRVLVLEDDHTAPMLEWHSRASAYGFTVETVARPGDLDWTNAVLAAIARTGAAPLAVVSISSVHWADGALLDMEAIASATRRQRAALVVDATQGAGVIPMDVTTIDPDALIFPSYKWLLGPYSRAFLYLAKRHQSGIPLEQTEHGRRNVRADNDVYLTDIAYTDTARRFDMGERDHFISLEMAAVSIEFVNAIGPVQISAVIKPLTDRLADGLSALPVSLTPAAHRTPHILSVGFPRGRPPDLADRLARKNVFAAMRLGKLRLSPHIYNDVHDIDRTVAALRDALS